MGITTLALIQGAIKKHDKELTAINNTVGSISSPLTLYLLNYLLISCQIWSNPELGYEEDLAHDSICKLFESKASEGYRVTRSTYGLKTSFRVDFGTGGRLVVLNAEYDALPMIGHACGHNLIATSSIAAFIGVCNALKETGHTSFATIRLLGTPAEEGGGGKIRLLEQGAYKDVSACLMAHPIQLTKKRSEIQGFASPAPGTFLANDKVQVTFRGKASHASLCPWEGINALDAAVAAYTNISMLRQQVPPTHRIHGVITNGGLRPNVIPEVATMEYYIRAPNAKQLKLLTERVVACLDGAAKSAECTVEYVWCVAIKIRCAKACLNQLVTYLT
jgi:amidohydrolase